MSDLDRLVLVVLHASDLEASLQVYRDVFEVPLEPGENEPVADPWMGGHHAELSWREGAYLHFALFPARPPERPVSTGAQIGFIVRDVEALHSKAVAGGVRVVHPPRSEPWGRTARYYDPDANIINITSR